MKRSDAYAASDLFAPYEIRTRVLALRGPRPRPLDERGELHHLSKCKDSGQDRICLEIGMYKLV